MKAKKAIQVVLFDVDDTLYDRDAAQTMVLESIVREFPSVLGALEPEHLTEAWVESDRITNAEYEAGVPPAGLRSTVPPASWRSR